MSVSLAFNRETIDALYKGRQTFFTGISLGELPTILSKTPNELVGKFKSHLKGINPDFSLDKDCATSWANAINKNEVLWKYRDYAFASSILFAMQLLAFNLPSYNISGKERVKPVDFDINENTFTVIGSTAYTSDIDVAVQGPRAYFIIQILEDFYDIIQANGIFIKCMDIEYYSDFRIGKDGYIDTSLFSLEDKLKILTYAYISYFRSTRKLEVTDLAKNLGSLFLKELKSAKPIDEIIASAKARWTTEAPGGVLDREKFYEYSKKVDELIYKLRSALPPELPPALPSELPPALRWKKAAAKVIKPSFTKPSFTDIVKSVVADRNKASAIYFGIADADIHRSESYILASTAAYIVVIEQIKKQVGGDGNSPSIIDVQKSITPLTLIACGIENCGYMEENLTLPTSALCNMKAAKYFGRLVRSLNLSKTVNVADYLKIAGELDTKKKKGEACDKDLTVLISEINGLIKPSAAGGYRRRKQKVTRRGRRRRRSTRRHYGKR
jgi:hypothetical protein